MNVECGVILLFDPLSTQNQQAKCYPTGGICGSPQLYLLNMLPWDPWASP